MDSFEHSAMAAWSSALDCGAQPAVEYIIPVNMVGVSFKGGSRFQVRVNVMLRIRIAFCQRFFGVVTIRSTYLDLVKSYKQCYDWRKGKNDNFWDLGTPLDKTNIWVESTVLNQIRNSVLHQ